ncbi:hypothetical protein IHE44_0008656 [Lamprotornis superbus]|uniref:Uncharacterized protein n=1 Tax=Lamprotornis superbus TaxID=245042 RepID=A0A835TW21_9PASS|nr:hypothetical protein IHE44_0008656 [Lamprotornis superbus]
MSCDWKKGEVAQVALAYQSQGGTSFPHCSRLQFYPSCHGKHGVFKGDFPLPSPDGKAGSQQSSQQSSHDDDSARFLSPFTREDSNHYPPILFVSPENSSSQLSASYPTAAVQKASRQLLL